MLAKLLQLLSNGSADSAEFYWQGGTGVMYAEATWNAGGVKLQTKSPNGTWMDVGTAVTFTANGVGAFVLPPGPIKAVITGAPSAIYASVHPVPALT